MKTCFPVAFYCKKNILDEHAVSGLQYLLFFYKAVSLHAFSFFLFFVSLFLDIPFSFFRISSSFSTKLLSRVAVVICFPYKNDPRAQSSTASRKILYHYHPQPLFSYTYGTLSSNVRRAGRAGEGRDTSD